MNRIGGMTNNTNKVEIVGEIIKETAKAILLRDSLGDEHWLPL